MYSTWLFIEPLGILFDCGDGVMSNLWSKSQKVKYLCLSHADRDHLGGLLQFHHASAQEGRLKVLYPEDSGTFPALRDFLEKFDPNIQPAEWIPIGPSEIPLKDHWVLRVHQNAHIPLDLGVKSLDFLLLEKRLKLKEEYLHLSGPELARLNSEIGKEGMSREVLTPFLGYSGDTPELEIEKWRGVKYLIHECTFIQPELEVAHCNLMELMPAMKELSPGNLILSHFSSRYKKQEILEAVRGSCAELQIDFPVWVLLPGRVYSSILAEDPVWKG